MTKRNISRYAVEQFTYESLKVFFESSINSGLHSINYENNFLDFLLDQSDNSDTLLVSFSPAVTNENATRPYFVGAGLFGPINSHKLYLSDPSLEINDELKLAWFAGSRSQRSLQADLTQILKFVISKLQVKKVILIGTSGGGFASLYYGSQLPGSLSIVVNPQTDITKYHPQHFGRYAKFAWGMTYQKAVQILPSRISTSVLELYKRETSNSILWLQNATDAHHIVHHFVPFLKNANTNCDMRVYLGDDWGSGHRPPPKEVQMACLAAAVDCNGDWPLLWGKFADLVTIGTALGRV